MSGRRVSLFQAVAYRFFGRHAEGPRHTTERRRLRSLQADLSLEEYLIRVYALSWVTFLAASGSVLIFGNGVFGPGGTGTVLVEDIRLVHDSGLPLGVVFDGGVASSIALGGIAIVAGILTKVATRYAARGVLGYLARRRRVRIDRTLPGAVRYLHVIAAGTTDPEVLFASVAAKESIHGATAESFEQVLRITAMTGSVETAIRRVARDTPSSDTLAPFLLTFLERTRDGPEAVRDFLRVESRLLARADERDHRRETRYLSTVVQLFVILLVVPVGLVLLAVGATFVLPDLLGRFTVSRVPELGAPLATTGTVTILVLGGLASLLVLHIRPRGYRWAAPPPATRPLQLLKRWLINPTNTLVVLGPIVLVSTGWLSLTGHPLSRTLLYGYVFLALPVGLVDRRRANRRAAIDRRLPAFVHALAQRLDNGLPFRRAVARVARAKDFGPLQPHLISLRYDLEVGTPDDGVRKRALERFVGRIGTPLSGRTIGLAVGALEAGADARAAFAALGTETGRLHHADQARRSRFPIIIAVGWTVALLIVAIVVTVNLMVIDAAAPMTTNPVEGVVVEASFGTVEGGHPLSYRLTQATMLASGWFAGVAGRGVYEGLLHSGALVAVTFIVFRIVGLV